MFAQCWVKSQVSIRALTRKVEALEAAIQHSPTARSSWTAPNVYLCDAPFTGEAGAHPYSHCTNAQFASIMQLLMADPSYLSCEDAAKRHNFLEEKQPFFQVQTAEVLRKVPEISLPPIPEAEQALYSAQTVEVRNEVVLDDDVSTEEHPSAKTWSRSLKRTWGSEDHCPYYSAATLVHSE